MINNQIIKTSIFTFFVCVLSASVATPLIDDASNALYVLSGCVNNEADALNLRQMSTSEELKNRNHAELVDLTDNSLRVLAGLNIFKFMSDNSSEENKNRVSMPQFAYSYKITDSLNSLNEIVFNKMQNEYTDKIFNIGPNGPELSIEDMRNQIAQYFLEVKKIAVLINMPDKQPEITLIEGLNGIGMLADGTDEEIAEMMRQLEGFSANQEAPCTDRSDDGGNF